MASRARCAISSRKEKGLGLCSTEGRRLTNIACRSLRQACTSFSSWMQTGPPRAPSAEGSSSSKAKPEATNVGGPAAAAAAAASLAASFGGERSEAELRAMRKDCPPDIEELGRYVSLLSLLSLDFN